MKDNFEHYYTPEPTSPYTIKEAVLSLRNGNSYRFKTPSGVFSFGSIDKASKLLIENAVLKGNERILDLGCGYGCIGITLKKEFPDITLFMSEVNSRAYTFSKINARDNNIEATIELGSVFEPWESTFFDTIVCNPPMAAGKLVWERMLRESQNHLNHNGSLQIVAFHNKGGRRIEGIMKEIFGNANPVVKSGGIRVYVSING